MRRGGIVRAAVDCQPGVSADTESINELRAKKKKSQK